MKTAPNRWAEIVALPPRDVTTSASHPCRSGLQMRLFEGTRQQPHHRGTVDRSKRTATDRAERPQGFLGRPLDSLGPARPGPFNGLTVKLHPGRRHSPGVVPTHSAGTGMPKTQSSTRPEPDVPAKAPPSKNFMIATSSTLPSTGGMGRGPAWSRLAAPPSLPTLHKNPLYTKGPAFHHRI